VSTCVENVMLLADYYLPSCALILLLWPADAHVVIITPIKVVIITPIKQTLSNKVKLTCYFT